MIGAVGWMGGEQGPQLPLAPGQAVVENGFVGACLRRDLIKGLFFHVKFQKKFPVSRFEACEHLLGFPGELLGSRLEKRFGRRSAIRFRTCSGTCVG